MKSPKLRMKCRKCGRASLYPVGKTTCTMSRLGQPLCGGWLDLYSADSDDATYNLIAAAKAANEKAKSPILAEAIEDLETWIENAPASPRAMGWVGNDGLP